MMDTGTTLCCVKRIRRCTHILLCAFIFIPLAVRPGEHDHWPRYMSRGLPGCAKLRQLCAAMDAPPRTSAGVQVCIRRGRDLCAKQDGRLLSTSTTGREQLSALSTDECHSARGYAGAPVREECILYVVCHVRAAPYPVSMVWPSAVARTHRTSSGWSKKWIKYAIPVVKPE